MSKLLFIEPYDIFMPRGNSHWGVNSGDYGQIQMLPTPSIFAGAIRSFIAVHDADAFEAIKKGNLPNDSKYARSLGTLEEPGEFRIKNVLLVQKKDKGYEPIYSMPGDITIFDNSDVRMAKPVALPSVIKHQNHLPYSAVLKAPAKKPSGKYYLSCKGYEKYINGYEITFDDLISISSLWQTEMRVGIGLDSNTGTAKEGMLYSAESISFKENIGFLVEVEGADDVLPSDGTLSLGGDQRAADYCLISVNQFQYDLKNIEQKKKFKLILTTPAIFNNGWLPDNIEKIGEDYYLKYKDCSAKLVCAAINGYETVSGWNMVKNMPKVAMKSVPAGSVYWFENFEGALSSLNELLNKGLWCENADRQRVAEGYNRFAVAAY